MATPRYCISALSRTNVLATVRPTSSFPLQQVRAASNSANAAKYKRKDAALATKKKKKTNASFSNPDLRNAEQFALCDAMRSVELTVDTEKKAYKLKLETATSVPLKLAANPHPPNTKWPSSYERRRTVP